MIRLLLFFVLLAILAYGGVFLVQHPGHVTLDWFGYAIQTSAALLVIAVAATAVAAWIVLRIAVGLPSFVRLAARQRRREKGYAALSRGLVAVGAGDAQGAARASAQASRHLSDDALVLLLHAQASHLNGREDSAVHAFHALAQREDTRVVGLRGLYAAASRRGDEEAARHFAEAAHRAAPLPWSAQAVLEQRAHVADWQQALATVESSVAAKLVDKDTGARQRAVLETAIAYDKEGTAPEEALSLARAAMKRAPDLAPPVVLAARLLSRRGDIRKAAKLIERSWPQCQHPDVAQAYLDVRPGDSTTDRLTRAKTLMDISTFDPVSRMTVARAALAGTEYAAAREAMAPLVGEGKRPTVRMCLMMAEIEEAEHGDIGQWREWLARASHAALDPAWVADGTVYDRWQPVSPTTGKLDAFRWQVPAERLGPVMEAMPAPRRRALTSAPGSAMLEHKGRPAAEPADPEELLPSMADASASVGPAPTEPDVGAPALAELAVLRPREAPPSPVRTGHATAPERRDDTRTEVRADTIPLQPAASMPTIERPGQGTAQPQSAPVTPPLSTTSSGDGTGLLPPRSVAVDDVAPVADEGVASSPAEHAPPAIAVTPPDQALLTKGGTARRTRRPPTYTSG